MVTTFAPVGIHALSPTWDTCVLGSRLDAALARARANGIHVRHHGSGWSVSSASHPGHWHTVQQSGVCSCPAGRVGQACQHLAAVRAGQVAAGEGLFCPGCGAWWDFSADPHACQRCGWSFGC